MKRSALLKPLSREHHTALKLAKACERGAISDDATLNLACQHAIQAYENELAAHFLYEEQTLLPLLIGTPEQPLAERTVTEHRLLYSMLDGLRHNNADVLLRFGKFLTEHVRFEERELFPVLENKFLEQNKIK